MSFLRSFRAIFKKCETLLTRNSSIRFIFRVEKRIFGFKSFIFYIEILNVFWYIYM